MNLVQEPAPEETNAPNGEVAATDAQAADGDEEEAGDGNYSSIGLCAFYGRDAKRLHSFVSLDDCPPS